jgi:hypothetical protein
MRFDTPRRARSNPRVNPTGVSSVLQSVRPGAGGLRARRYTAMEDKNGWLAAKSWASADRKACR